MSDTRSPPLANTLPPGRRPWLPEGGRPPVAEGWRSSEAPVGQASAAGRESRRASRGLSDKVSAKGGLQQRAPRPAPLLRPQRQFGRKVAVGAGFLLAGVVGGLALGLSLRPGAPTQQQQREQRAEASVAAVPPGATLPGATVPDPALGQGGLPKAALFAGGSDAPRPAPAAPAVPAPRGGNADGGSDAEAVRKGLAAEQSRLEALAQARAAAEAQLAQLQAQVAQREILARREAALAALPSVTAPLPTPPRGEAGPRQAGGIGAGTTGGGAAQQQQPSGQQRVVLHHRAGSYAASEAAGAMAAQVREAGFDLNETRAVTATPSQRVVRYFHAEDAPAAARLAGRLGRGWALQDFRSYEPLPSPGLLEVWLPDR
jgi:hypothetical protein